MSTFEVVDVDDSDDGGGSISDMVMSFELMDSPRKSQICERAEEHETVCTRNIFKTDEDDWRGDESCRPKITQHEFTT